VKEVRNVGYYIARYFVIDNVSPGVIVEVSSN
jgi:hypothetical protein